MSTAKFQRFGHILREGYEKGQSWKGIHDDIYKYFILNDPIWKTEKETNHEDK